MKLKAALLQEGYDKLDENLREFYTEKDGVFLLDVEQTEIENEETGKKQVYALDDIFGLKTTLADRKQRHEEAQKKLKAFEDLDPDAAREALKKLEEIGDGSDNDKKVTARIEKLKKELDEKHQTELKEVAAGKEELEAEVNRLLVDNAARGALEKHKLVPSGQKFLLQDIKNQVRVVKDEKGRFGVRVVDKDGQDRISTRSGENNLHMGIDELVESMAKQDDYKIFFAGSGNSGTSEGNTQEGARRTGGTNNQPSGEQQNPPRRGQQADVLSMLANAHNDNGS